MTTRDRRALVFGVAFIGLAVAYRLVISPALDRWSQARADAQAQVELVDQFEDRLNKRDTIRRRLADRFGPGVHDPLRTINQARVDFPRSVQEAFERSGSSANQIEVQGTRRVRQLAGVELLSIRVQAECEPHTIPNLLKEISQADLPVLIDSVQLAMAGRNRRDKWQATFVLSTPARIAGTTGGSP